MRVSNYILEEEVGSGAFSTVYKATLVKDKNQLFAIKCLKDIPENVEWRVFRLRSTFAMRYN
jgi:serine/threonine protein kinase